MLIENNLLMCLFFKELGKLPKCPRMKIQLSYRMCYLTHRVRVKHRVAYLKHNYSSTLFLSL